MCLGFLSDPPWGGKKESKRASKTKGFTWNAAILVVVLARYSKGWIQGGTKIGRGRAFLWRNPPSEQMFTATYWCIADDTCINLNPVILVVFLVHLSRRLKCTILSSVRPSSFTWDIFDFSSKTAERNSKKLDRKQDLNVLYQVCVFRADRKKKQDGRPGLWLAGTFSTSPLKSLNKIQRQLSGSKISRFSTKFVFFGPIGKTRWMPWPLIDWDIFYFSSKTADRNSTKLDRKQDLNVLYSLCFSGRSEKQDDHTGLWLVETFSTSPLKPLNGLQRNLTGRKISTSSTKFVFFRPIEKQDGRPGQSVKKVAHCTQVHDMGSLGHFFLTELFAVGYQVSDKRPFGL